MNYRHYSFLTLFFVVWVTILFIGQVALAQNPPEFGPFPSIHEVIFGGTVQFIIIAQDDDEDDTLTITKDGPGILTTTPGPSPDTGFYSWTTQLADTAGSPHVITFYVQDDSGYADTAKAYIFVSIPDTVEVECLERVPAQTTVTVELRLFNDKTLTAFTIPLLFDNGFLPDVFCDSIHWSDRFWNNVATLYAGYPGYENYVDTANYTINIWATWFGGGLPPGDGSIATIYFTTGAAWDTSCGVVIDTTFILPGSRLLLSDLSAKEQIVRFYPGCLDTSTCPENYPPEIAVPGTQEVTAGDTVEFMVIGTDPNSEDILTLILEGKGTLDTTPGPSPDTGFFQWVTTDADSEASPYMDTFIVNDGKGYADTGYVQIIVNPFVHNPKLTVPGPQIIVAGDTLEFMVIATDPDPEDTLTITKDGPGELQTTPHPTPDSGFYKWETVLDDTLGSPYTVTFYVDDGTGLSDTGEVVIIVLPYIPPPREGDLNRDGNVDVLDIVFLVNFLFLDGSPPDPPASADINGDCYITVTDLVYLINYVWHLGPDPKQYTQPGDADYDGYVNLLDVVYLIEYIGLSGPEPPNMKSADLDSSCVVDLEDIVYLVSFIFRGGPKPLCGCAGEEVLLLAKALLLRETADVGFRNPVYNSEEKIIEIPIAASFNIPVAGVQLLVEYDQEKFEPLQPLLTARTNQLSIFSSHKFGSQVVGILDLKGERLIEASEGDLLLLRFKSLTGSVDLSGIRVLQAIFVDKNAHDLEVRMEQNFGIPELK